MSIAPLPHASAPVPAEYLEFLEALKAAGFEGDVDTDHASRTVLATDNSIYQRMPQAAISASTALRSAAGQRTARTASRQAASVASAAS